MLDLQRYAAMQQMNQARPPQQGGGQIPPMQNAPQPAPYNPISEGTRLGMQAAKESIRLDDEQRQNAMKSGIMSFITNAAKPGTGSGFSGFLRSVSQGLEPGMNAYNQEASRAQANNHVLLSNQLEAERQHRKEMWDRERAAQKDQFERQWLGIEQAKANRLSKEDAKLQKIADKKNKLISEGKIPEGALLWEEQTPGMISQNNKDLQERRKEVRFAKEGMHTLQKMKELMLKKENKHLWNSFGKILDIADNKDPSVWNNFLSSFNQREITALQIMRKYTTKLGLYDLKSMGGRPSDILKKAVFAATPSANMTPEAFDQIASDVTEGFRETAKDQDSLLKAEKYGAYIPRSLSMYEEGQIKGAQDAQSGGDNQDPGMILQRIKEQYPEFTTMIDDETGQPLTDEQILMGAKANGLY